MTHRQELLQAFDALLGPERFKDYGPNGLQVEGRALTVDFSGLPSQVPGCINAGYFGGGLTVARQIHKALPNEDLVYLGDTARVPYGSKSPETIRRFSDEDARYLLGKNVKAIIVACNTATAHALPFLQQQYRIPVIGVIEAGVEAVLADPQAQRIGITPAGAHARAKQRKRFDPVKHRDPARTQPLSTVVIDFGMVRAMRLASVRIFVTTLGDKSCAGPCRMPRFS